MQLGAGAGRLPDRGPAAAAAHRESLEQPGADVRRAEGEELLVGVGAVAAADRERAAGQHVVGVPDQQHTSRRQQQAA